MEHLRTLSLLAGVAAAMMAFVADASADYVTSTTGSTTEETPTVHAVHEGTHVTLANPIANISCASTVSLSVTDHVHSGPVTGDIFNLAFTGCTNSWHVTTVSSGTFDLQGEGEGGHNGELYSTGTRVDATRLGVTCEYETKGTYIGTVTGGNPATLKIEGFIPINTSTSSGLCGTSDAKWEGSYTTTSALYVVTH